LVATAALAFENEPAGFRGLVWGDSLVYADSQVHLTFNRKLGDEYLEYRSNDNLKLGRIPLRAVVYEFYHGRFSLGGMVADRGYEKDLLDTLMGRFGVPQRHRGDRQEWMWVGNTTSILMICHRDGNSCGIDIRSTKIDIEIARDRGAEAGANKDF
jgi:hypothetical protein